MTEIVWEDPPPSARPGDQLRWLDRISPLREHPGKWAFIGEYPTTSAAANARAGIRAKPGYESVQRKVDGSFRVYARYTGQEA